MQRYTETTVRILNFFLSDFWAVPHILIASFLFDKLMPVELRMLVYRRLVLAGLTEFIVWLKILTQEPALTSLSELVHLEL